MASSEPLDTLAAPVHAELVVTRSRFLATVTPVDDAEAAAGEVARARGRWHAARHHCWAYVLGPDGHRRRSSDDGEPSGTAGPPILAVLEGAGLTDVVAVVTRYFGGTLLGAGGLVRAYGGAVSAALEDARRIVRRQVTVLEIATGHAEAGHLEHRVRTWADTAGAHVEPGRYGARDVRIEVAVPPSAVPSLRTLLIETGTAHELHDLGLHLRDVGTAAP